MGNMIRQQERDPNNNRQACQLNCREKHLNFATQAHAQIIYSGHYH